METRPQQFRLLQLAYSVPFLLLIVGIYAAALGQRFGAYLMVIGLTGHLVAHLVVLGIVGYREAMSRPWPKVRPVDDDNDDDW